MNSGRLVGLVLMVVGLATCSSDRSSSDTTGRSSASNATTVGGRYSAGDPAFKLASLDLGHVATRDEEVEPYAEALALLHTRCSASRDRLPEMVFNGRQKLVERGRSISLLEFLQALAVHGPTEHTSADCGEYIAGTVFIMISEGG